MNYKNMAKREFANMIQEFPEYSLQELIYSVTHSNPFGNKVSSVLELSDKEMYNTINQAKDFEKEEGFIGHGN